jgi:methylthioribose-1-phosphate isomerase
VTVENSLSIIAICQAVMVVAGLGTAIGIIYAIVSFKKALVSKIDEAFERVEPVIDSAAKVAQQAQETVERVSEKVDRIAAKAAETTEAVGDRVQSVTQKFDEVLNPEVMKAVGIGTAILKAFNLVQLVRKAHRQEEKEVPTEDGGV